MSRRVVAWALALAGLVVAVPALAKHARADADGVVVHQRKLANGLEVLVAPRHHAPLISFQVWYRAGSRDEAIGESGISHLVEHLMFQGSPGYPTGRYDELVERNGGSNNAFTTEDFTAYYVDLPADRLALAASLEADRMRGLLMPTEKFGSELSVVKEERRWRTENDPFGMMWEMLGATAYVQHPYRWPVVGWMDDLDRMTRDRAMAYYKRHYHPDQAVVVVTGDVKPDVAFRSVATAFGNIPRGPKVDRAVPVEPPQRGERRTTLLRPVQAPAVMLAYHIGNRADADYHALVMAERILSSGRSSRLQKDLVDTRKLAQDVGASAMAGLDPGLFLVYAVPMPGHTAEELEMELQAALDRLAREPITERERQKAFDQARAAHLMGMEKNHDLGIELGTAAMLGDWRRAFDVVPGLAAVTPEKVREVAARTFRKANRSVIVLEPDATGSGETGGR
ncbi:MAG: pitrilysin family protein [Candidatus Sericytochromatia bacterium]|nr:pitrilysin family protein [Candidatus Sericytochromatia bacterium]